MLYIITIKWTMCVQEKIELSNKSQTPRLRRSLSYKDKVTLKNCKKFPVVANSWHPVAQGGIYHSMPPRGYGPAARIHFRQEKDANIDDVFLVGLTYPLRYALLIDL